MSRRTADDLASLFEDPVASRQPGSEEDAHAIELALERSRAIATLLRGEVSRLRGDRTVDVLRTDESADGLARRGAVIPTDALIARLIGRVRPLNIDSGPNDRQATSGRRPSITVATRFHDVADLPSLERSLASLQAQQDVDLTPLIVLQRLNESGVRAVHDCVSKVWLAEPEPRVVNVEGPAGADLRSALLNRALDIHYTETSDDFFYVLDHDDLVFSHALASLAGPVVGSRAAVSFGKVLVARYLSLESYDFLYNMEDHFKPERRDITELVIDNFFPIHGYVYHTRAMPRGRLRFNESMDRLEDFEALLRVVTDFPVYTGAVDTLVGLYCWKGQRAIHGPIQGASDEEAARWDRNRLALANAYVEVTSSARGGP